MTGFTIVRWLESEIAWVKRIQKVAIRTIDLRNKISSNGFYHRTFHPRFQRGLHTLRWSRQVGLFDRKSA